MANTLLGEKREGQGGIRSSGGVPVLDEVYHYLVKMDSGVADRIEVLGVSGVPIVGTTLSAGGYAVCQAVEAVRRENQRRLWDITATFSSDVDERQTSASVSSNPETWVPIYETKFERLQEIATKDQNGNPIANSAGQPFENGIIRGLFIPFWELYQFEAASVTDETVIDRNETVNNATFKGRAPHTLLCTVMSSVIGFYYGARRRFTKYSIRYNRNTWKHKRLDVGTVYLEGGVHKPYLDDEENVMLGALNGAGAKQPPGTAPEILEFAMYPEVTFTSFLRI